MRTYQTHSSSSLSSSTAPPNNDSDSEGDSSPFMSHVGEDDQLDKENPLPPSASAFKSRPISRIISGSELSPLKILQDRPPQESQPTPPTIDEDQPSPPPPLARGPLPPLAANPLSPRKLSSPIKRFPVKINVPTVAEASRASPAGPSPALQETRPEETVTTSRERTISLEDALRGNDGLKHAIEIFESEDSVLEQDGAAGGDPAAGREFEEEHFDEHEPAGIDDTMMSTFSNFSAVPNLATLTNMRSTSPSKLSAAGGATPRARGNPSPMRTPQANPAPYDAGNTTNLMEFTEQMRFGAYMQQQQQQHQAGRSRASLSGADFNPAATPQRNNLVNLLDFDIPPMPTPRSIPTITPRELESLKSGFLSEISSLKASLSGKEAEVTSLKTAVQDAEKRVGECMEQLREVQGLQSSLTTDRDSWEKRGREMEVVLRKVKEEIVISQREREELEFKLDEAEKRGQAAEMMAQDAESKMAGMRAGRASADAAAERGSSSPNGVRSPGAKVTSNREVEIAVERVARELHALYKSKHETKVTALKKSYESRWEKKVNELREQVEELTRENDELRVGRDATMTKVDLARLTELEEERKVEKAKDAALIKEMEAERKKLEAVVRTVKEDNHELRDLLEKERVEKGELVQLAEEMMNIQAAAPPPAAPPALAPVPEPTPEPRRTPRPVSMGPGALSSGIPARGTPLASRVQEGLVHTGSIKRPSGLRAPGSLRPPVTESRIGRMTHERTKSAGVGGGGVGARSGIMSSIERMGNYRTRGD